MSHHPNPQNVTLPDHERQRCEVWTRVMGYFRPVKSFNIGKKGEYHERITFKEGALGSRAISAGRLADSYEEFQKVHV